MVHNKFTSRYLGRLAGLKTGALNNTYRTDRKSEHLRQQGVVELDLANFLARRCRGLCT